MSALYVRFLIAGNELEPLLKCYQKSANSRLCESRNLSSGTKVIIFSDSHKFKFATPLDFNNVLTIGKEWFVSPTLASQCQYILVNEFSGDTTVGRNTNIPKIFDLIASRR